MLSDGKMIEWLSTGENVKDHKSHYQHSKLFEIFFVQELAKHIKRRANGQPMIIVNDIDPGLCHSKLTRHITEPGQKRTMTILKAIFARTEEHGSRTLVNGGENGNFETHGKYLTSWAVGT
jgi:NADP-dependent 3-hydroxy acid dehydrogenase YdfG